MWNTYATPSCHIERTTREYATAVHSLWQCLLKVIRKEVGSFETQPATHDVTGVTRYSSNIAIYMPMYMCLHQFILIFRLSNFFELINFPQHKISQIISSTCKIFSISGVYLKCYPTCLKTNTIIFPKIFTKSSF